MNKNILITGAKGFLAQNLAKTLSKKKFIIYGMGHGKLSDKEQKKLGYKKFISGSISEKNLNKISQKIDIIIHCAGKSIGYEPLRDFNKNSLSTYILLDHVSKLKKKPKIYFTSSIAVGVKNKKKINEKNNFMPFSHYGLNKKISEDICKFYVKKFKLNITILRISSLFGVGLKKQFIYDAIIKIINDNNFFWGTGKEVRDFIHINDICKIIYRLIDIKQSGLEIYNCGSGNLYTTKEVIKIIQSLIGKEYPVIFDGQGMDRNPRYLIPSIKKIKDKIKFNSNRNFIQDINEQIENISKKK